MNENLSFAAPTQDEQSVCYISPLDGAAIPMKGRNFQFVMQNELERAGKMIAELREDVRAIKAHLVIG